MIITRAEGRTPVPEREQLKSLAAHGSTMVLFLSSSLLEKAQADLMAGGYAPDTPAAIVYKATWPDEKVYRCTVATLARDGAGKPRDQDGAHHRGRLFGLCLRPLPPL